MSKFFWGNQGNEAKMTWMSWERMGLSKQSGGLGFRDLECFNRAMLAKQGGGSFITTRFFSCSGSKTKYYPQQDFMSATLGSRPSYAWRSILNSRSLLKEGLAWRVGDGKSIRIWGDKWIPESALPWFILPHAISP
ncbi:hypothetical protein SLA2020_271940 [Shorea laevis]